MERIIKLVIVLLLITDTAYGAAPAALRPSEVLFRGNEIQADDFYTEKSSKLESFSDRVIEAIIAKHGMSVQNAKAHGMRQNEYVYRKARTVFPVKHIDVDVVPVLPGRFRFNMYVSDGTEFFAETEPRVIENCLGMVNSDGVITVKLDECVANHFEQHM